MQPVEANIPTEQTVFDTTYVTKNKQELIKIDTVSSVIFDENIRVHSSTYDLLSSGEEVSFREFTLTILLLKNQEANVKK